MQNFTILHPVVKKFFAKEQTDIHTDRQTDRHTGNFIYIDDKLGYVAYKWNAIQFVSYSANVKI